MSCGETETCLEGIRILVFDHVESLCWLKAHLLRKRAAEVITARTGQEALGMLGTGGVDLALLDASLPDLERGQLRAAMLANPVTARIPVICTGDTMFEPAPTGCDAFLPLPLNSEELARTVRRLLGRETCAAGS